MNVLLINPPTINEITGTYPEAFDSDMGYSPPLSILYLAGYIEEKGKHKVKIIDAQVERLNYLNLEKKLVNEEFDIVGITIMTFLLIDVIKTIDVVKKVNPKCKIVVGGAHVNLYPYETINLKNINFVVLGEGEVIFNNLLDNIEDVEKLKNIKGLVFKSDEDEIIHTGFPDNIKDLDSLPFPARHLTPYKKYSSVLAVRLPITTMMTSRGCPFKCSFCDRPHLGKKFRAVTAQRVVEEMETAIKLGINEFLIYDDTFTVDKKRVKTICNLIIDKKLDVGFDIRARVDTVNEEIIALLKKAGCRGIHYGVEAGTEKILKVLNKGIKLEKVKEVFKLTKKYKIKTLAYFMIGSPEETKQDIMQTFKFAKKLNPDYFHLSILSPFPGTKIYFDGLANNTIKTDYWREFAKNPSADFKMLYWEENLDRKELEMLLIKGYKQFYTRPLYIVSQILKVKSTREFFKKAKAGIKLFFLKKVSRN